MKGSTDNHSIAGTLKKSWNSVCDLQRDKYIECFSGYLEITHDWPYELEYYQMPQEYIFQMEMSRWTCQPSSNILKQSLPCHELLKHTLYLNGLL